MSLRNKLAIVSFTLMSLMTIPTLAENDNAPVTSRIEDALHSVEIKVPEGWQETKGFEMIPESFELWGSVFHGVKFKNGTEQHGYAIFFASDTDDDEDDLDDSDDGAISDAALAQAGAHVQEKAFPDSEPFHFELMNWNLEGNIHGNSETITKSALKGSLEGNLAKKSGGSMSVSVRGKIDYPINNFAIGTGRIALGNAITLCGATGVVLDKNYGLIMISWGADEQTLERDIHQFKNGITITPKPAKAKPVATEITRAVVTEEITRVIVVAEPVVIIEENQQVVAPAELVVAAVEEKKDAQPVAAVEEQKPVAASAEPVAAVEPVAVVEEKSDAAPAEPVAAAEVTAPVESPVAAETAQAAVSEPVNTAETPA